MILPLLSVYTVSMGNISFMRHLLQTALISSTLLGAASPCLAGESLPLNRSLDEIARTLPQADRVNSLDSRLSFTRQIGVGGLVSGTTFAASVLAAGVPAAAMEETWRGFASAIDLIHDPRDGDGFHVRFEQTFSWDGQPTGAARVLWAELRSTAKGTIALHRFASKTSDTMFWLTSGTAAALPAIRMPVDVVKLSSGYGLRADPLDKEMGTASAIGPLPDAAPVATEMAKEETAPALEVKKDDKPVRKMARSSMSFGGIGGGSGGSRDVFEGTRAAKTAPVVDEPAAPEPEQKTETAALAPKLGPKLFMHEGLDLVAAPGAPVYAAADGVVFGAGPNGRYGNWIRIDHAGKLSTVYGHLAGFEPGIVPGAIVKQGKLIGFIGTTGRTTGPHLHFEVLSNGRAVDPLARPELSRAQLRGAEFERFRKQVRASLAERVSETALP